MCVTLIECLEGDSRAEAARSGMSGQLFCHGCGQKLKVEPGYRRARMQCPVCGVLVEVPEELRAAAPEAPPPKPPPDEADEDDAVLSAWKDAPAEEAESAAQPAAEAAAEAKPPPKKKRDPSVPTCRHCGDWVRVRARHGGAPQLCPTCGLPWDAPAPGADPQLELEPDEDDGAPYDVFGAAEQKKCPSCRRELNRRDRVCVGCGYDFRTRKKLVKVYDEVRRHWTTGPSRAARLGWFLAVQGVILPLLLLGSLAAGAVAVLVPAWLLFSAMLAFLFGTFDDIDLERDRRGRVQLSKTWHVCFFRRAPTPLEVAGHAGVHTGRVRESGIWEWFIFLSLCGFGCVPAVVWWYLAIYRDVFFVALTRDHGFPATSVYRGGSEEQMRDIADALSAATGLHCDRE
jgi:hypothetical protein